MESATPGWVLFLPLILLVGGVALSRSYLARHPPPDRGLFWTERARREFPVGQGAITFALLWQWVTLLFVTQLVLRDWSTPARLAWVFASVGCCRAIVPLVQHLGRRRLRPALHPRFDWRFSVETALATAIVGVPHPWRFVSLGVALGYVVASWVGLFIPRNARAMLPPESIAAIEASLGSALVDRIGVLRSPHANAWSVGRRIALGSQLVAELTPAELTTIVAHEMNHAAQWAVRVNVLLLAVLEWCALTLLVSLQLPWNALSVAGCGVLAVVLLRRSSRHDGEFRADEVADRAGLARALEKIHEFELIPAVFGERTTHPSLVDRLRKLGHEPAWAIPQAPGGAPAHEGLLALVGLVVLTMALASPRFPTPWFWPARAPAPTIELRPVREALARLECQAARAALPPEAPPAIRELVSSCNVAKAPGCGSLFETPVDVLGEEVQILALQGQFVVEVDRAWMLRQGLIPPPDTGSSETTLLNFDGKLELVRADSNGVSWALGDSRGAVPWLAIRRITGGARCWER